VLITGHSLGQRLLDQSKMEVLLASLILAILVLVQLQLLVQFLSVDLGDVLDHHCHVLRVELALIGKGCTWYF
jgi:hypothetical protein